MSNRRQPFDPEEFGVGYDFDFDHGRFWSGFWTGFCAALAFLFIVTQLWK